MESSYPPSVTKLLAPQYDHRRHPRHPVKIKLFKKLHRLQEFQIRFHGKIVVMQSAETHSLSMAQGWGVKGHPCAHVRAYIVYFRVHRPTIKAPSWHLSGRTQFPLFLPSTLSCPHFSTSFRSADGKEGKWTSECKVKRQKRMGGVRRSKLSLKAVSESRIRLFCERGYERESEGIEKEQGSIGAPKSSNNRVIGGDVTIPLARTE